MGQYADFVCDLHGHTVRSDGNDTPLQFLQHAAERQMQVVAITDHDKLPPESVEVDGQTREIVSYAKSLGLHLIKGIEISCETEIEDVHLVCFGCDWNSDYFKKLDEMTIASKVEGYRELLRRLDERGMHLSWDEILYNHGDPIGEESVQKKLIFNMIAEKGYTKDWSEAKLMVKQDPDLSVPRRKPDAVGVIHEIHRQGGIIIQAHPYLVVEPVHFEGQIISREALIDRFIFEGLDGIEARYTYDKTSYGGTQTKQEIYREVIDRYQGRLPIISGGSDYHGEWRKGVKDAREIGECGLTAAEFYANPILRGLIAE